MAFLLRTVKQNRWLRSEAEAFLEADDVPADSVSDLPTQQNLLSVWQVADDRSNVERAVRAVAVGRDKIDNAGYVLFDAARIAEVGIEIRRNEGTSLDSEANSWHRDLVVSGKKLVALVDLILRHGESGTVLRARMRQLVEEGIQAGEIPEKLRAKLRS